MRFRKKPVIIDAIQWTGDNTAELIVFTGNQFEPIDTNETTDDPEATARVLDSLHSTWVLVQAGDWIIRGVKGEFYPCRDEVFRETYEPTG